MVVIIGGTFSVIHLGHERLFDAALERKEKIIVGLTTDDYVASSKEYDGIRYSERKKALEEYLESRKADFEIKPLTNSLGNASQSSEYSAIVVSPESYHNAIRINMQRERNGLRNLEIIKVPYVLGDDYFPIKSSRILQGEIDRNGKRLRPVRISLSTCNASKMDATTEFFGKLIAGSIVVQNKEYRTPSPQPFGGETYEYARIRAESGISGNDYSVGLESGLIPVNNGEHYLDIHYCCIIDRFGKITTGSSSGFQIPLQLVMEIKKGKELSNAFSSVYGNGGIYSEKGIAGLISGNFLQRIDLYREALRNAFVPRIKPDYYS
ncbi:MAG: pantetheine-phosphate adenylyltransferase [Candidatus Thermoplasmatota archaeon]|nr:pantetheine-phosphate adenylyltransferase [Candidatus Thermoplasmatota archaeon]MCL5731702.1 pantetheine-phosphate adenylyltransferase [Candidatus Thermoplasmatota archaeon]